MKANVTYIGPTIPVMAGGLARPIEQGEHGYCWDIATGHVPSLSLLCLVRFRPNEPEVLIPRRDLADALLDADGLARAQRNIRRADRLYRAADLCHTTHRPDVDDRSWTQLRERYQQRARQHERSAILGL